MKMKLKKYIRVIVSLAMVVTIASISKDYTEATESGLVNDGLELNKTATDNVDGTYTINLEAYTTGTVSTVQNAKPTDFIFVMDQSGSMTEDYNGKTRLAALKSGALSFLAAVTKDAKENKVDHRMSIVGFAGGSNDGILGESYKSFLHKWDLDKKPELYKNQLLNINEQSASLEKRINALSAYGDTHPEIGMEIAENIYKHDDVSSKDRQRIVVFFTDGDPHDLVFNNGEGPTAIKNAYTLKNTYNAKLFSIGAIPAAHRPIDVERIRNFLNYSSSNYPDAKSAADTGVGKDDGYFLEVTKEIDFEKVFDTIFEQIMKPSIELGTETILKDVMSDYFVTPSKDNVRVSQVPYLGKQDGVDVWGTSEIITDQVNVEVSGNDIEVSGFDYTSNFVGIDSTTGKAKGKKLVISFETGKEQGFIGGNNVPTNKDTSGIYVDDKIIDKFPEPIVDVAIDFVNTANAAGIYIGSNISNPNHLFDASLDTGLQFATSDVAIHTYNGKNNKYVDIVHTVMHDGKEIGKYTILAGKTEGSWDREVDFTQLTDNTKISITSTVTPTTTGTIVPVTDAKDTTIYVYTPSISVEDKVVFLGEETDLDSLVNTNVIWANQDVNAVSPTGTQPTLVYQYIVEGSTVQNKGTYAPKEDVKIKMIVNNNGKDITQYTTISNPKNHVDYDLFMQVVKGELSITKDIDQKYTKDNTINANQTFVYAIDVRDTIGGPIREIFYQTIDFSANEETTSKTVTLTNLSKGYYTVTEESDWSWKYKEDPNMRLDNYNGNGTSSGIRENQSIFIGERQLSGDKMFYGSAFGTTIDGKDQSYLATTKLSNFIKNTNILGDGANAKNKFVKNNP